MAAYQEVTRERWRDAAARFHLVASELVRAECAAGDSAAARARLGALEGVALLAAGGAEEMARRLVDLGAVPREAAADAAHIAIVAANGVDYLVTWNFRHIANAAMRVRIEGACREAGYARAVRDAFAAQSDYDVGEMFRRIREMQDESGREYVEYPAHRIVEGSDESLAV